ncbi:MAG: hypothetical protein IPL47_04625 [Phyllobacteriaceae bacterium]|nr:hypothetical protein [Phyllobacteriaceae bacterium]
MIHQRDIDAAAPSGDLTMAWRIGLLALLFTLLPPRPPTDADRFHPDFGVAAAFADDGEGRDGGDDGGEDGEDGEDDGEHGVAGSTVGGFLGALSGHGRVRNSVADANTVILFYADGWSERVIGDRYQLRDRKNRIVISRKAWQTDKKRLRAALR